MHSNTYYNYVPTIVKNFKLGTLSTQNSGHSSGRQINLLFFFYCKKCFGVSTVSCGGAAVRRRSGCGRTSRISGHNNTLSYHYRPIPINYHNGGNRLLVYDAACDTVIKIIHEILFIGPK